MRMSGEGADKGVMIIARNMLSDESHSEWKFLDVVVEFHVMEFKVEHVPLTSIN